MGKEIDVSKAADWSDEEAEFNKQYLRDRGRTEELNQVLEARDEDTVPSGVSGGTELDPNPRSTSDSGTKDTPLNKVKPQQAEPDSTDSDEDDEEDEEEEESDEVDYNKWTNEELREELDRRELPKTGNKDELVARLTEDDDEEESE